MWARAGVDEEGGTAAVADLQEVAQLEFGALDASGIEVDGVHGGGEIECDDEGRFVFGEGRLLPPPCRACECNRPECDEQADHVNGAQTVATLWCDDEVVEEVGVDVTLPAGADIVMDAEGEVDQRHSKEKPEPTRLDEVQCRPPALHTCTLKTDEVVSSVEGSCTCVKRRRTRLMRSARR